MRGVLFVLLLACPATEAASPLPELLRQEAARLETQREALQGVAEQEIPKRVRGTLLGLRERLIDAGVDAGFADALVPAGRIVSDDRPAGAASHVLALTRRKLLRTAEAAERAPPDLPQHAEAELMAILDDPEFADRDTGANLVRRLLTRINEFLVPLIGGVVTAVSRHGKLLTYTVLAVLVLTLVWIFVRLFPAAARAPRRRFHGPGSTPLERGPGAEQLLHEARRAWEDGDAVQTLRQAQLAAVVALRSRDLLPPTPGLTDLEGVRLLASRNDDAGRRFDRLARLHDRAIYGGRRPDRAAAETALQLASELVSPSAAESAA